MRYIKTAERVSNTETSDNYVFQRCLLAYKMASKMLHGKVLEIGTGSGYGITEISPHVDEFWTIDKNQVDVDYNQYHNTRFIKKTLPPFENMPQDYFDYVICFHVIEHINQDSEMLKEIYSVLKNGGKLIISTPNIEKSLTRNPWHIREYTRGEFTDFLKERFEIIKKWGVHGDGIINEYYLKNKRSVNRILKFDLLKLNKRLPRWILKIPYDIFNRINRKWLYKRNNSLVQTISANNFQINIATNQCFDFVFIVEKDLSLSK